MKNIGAEKQLSEYNHVYKENTAIYRDLSIRLGLNESTFWILYTLRIEEPPVTQSDMCAILAYPKQTVNSALKKLEQEGLLTLFGERGRGGKPIRLTEAGVKLAEQTVDLVIEGEGDRRTKALLEELYAAVVRGLSLAEAMRRSGAFRPLECGVVRIGDETGRLARTLDFLRDYYRKRAAQRRMVASAVSYPVVILAVAAAVVAFMLSVVVPMFEEVYARMGGELPALTRGIIALSKAFPAYAAVAVIAGGGLYLLYRANRQREEVQRWRAAILLRLPVAGEIIRKNMQAQCCKLLDLLCAAGVPLLAGVGMLREVIGFHPYRKSFDEIARQLERGDAFAETLARFPDLYDRKLTALVRVGEQTNRLPEMLRRQGETLTEELEYAIRRMGAMLEPALILLVGILVAVILIAMYMPMFSLGGIMG